MSHGCTHDFYCTLKGQTMFEKDSLNEFTYRLASDKPIPGGGGASALAAALAASLSRMVTEVTLAGERSKIPETELAALSERGEELRRNFLHLIEKDAEVFKPLSEAYRLPKDSPGRDETLELCLRDAASAPLEMFDFCCKTVELLEELSEKCTGLIRSDIATGAAICAGALKGAACNVRINTKLMKDREYALKIDEDIDGRLPEYSAKAEHIFTVIYRALV